jgi:hypothetical protein
MAASLRSELEEARVQLSEGFLRVWEQADLIDKLLREGKPTEAAKDLLASMQKTLNELRRHVEVLTKGIQGTQP